MSQHGCPERLSNRSKGFQEDGGSQATMEVLVETLTGTAFEMTVSPSDTIFAIKSKIFRVEGIPVSQQHLLYNLKELEDSRSLRELHIASGARLRLVLGMRGGPVSTRRLPPPHEPCKDIERLLDSNRDEEWSVGGCSKVTVLVFRDGERVNMLRVKENHDGTYSPLDTNKYSAALLQLCEGGSCEPAGAGASAGAGAGAGAGALRENAVTMGKMLELRRRMESLTLQRTVCDTTTPGGKAEIQKTRSEEALPTHMRDELRLQDEPHLGDELRLRDDLRDDLLRDDLRDDLHDELPSSYTPFDADDCFTLDNNYTRYSYECGLGSRYTLLPPIGSREERHPPLARRQSRREGEEAAILEECLGNEECMRAASPRPAHTLHPVPHDYGEVVGGCAWRGHSASALQLRAGGCSAPRDPRDPRAHLDAPFSSSTSELENLKRNSRLLPGLSRARPREHLHLSDEGLHLRREPPPREPPPPDHRLYLGPTARAPDTQERLYLRREKRPPAAEPEPERLYLRRESRDTTLADTRPQGGGGGGGGGEAAAHTHKEKKVRLRCGWCSKRLSCATVHACRCGGAWCAAHRYAEVHGCAWDYKAEAHHPPSPSLHHPKLPKI